MQFLISNDDGFDAPGLAALFLALRPLGDVTVVAPAVCQSAKGHAVDTKSPLKLEHRKLEPFGTVHVVHSSPADCIRVGLKHVCQTPPDAVISGINPGANLGVDLFYSGTAAAAREAALLGVPAIAVSRLLQDGFPIDWAIVSRLTTRIVRTLLHEQFRLPACHFWNVNLPVVPNEQYPDTITFVPQGTGPHAVQFRSLGQDGDIELLEYTGNYRQRKRSEGCDVDRLFGQNITATPISPDMTGQTLGIPSRSPARLPDPVRLLS
jgi:5'-nucleotidase